MEKVKKIFLASFKETAREEDMKLNKITWIIVATVVVGTVALIFGTFGSYSQVTSKPQPSPSPEKIGYEDRSRYPVVAYNAPEPVNALELEERKKKGKRYDERGFVLVNPHPEDGGVELTDEVPYPPSIPEAESDLIIVGEILDAKAYLSNDKSGIYAEYAVRVKEILKEDESRKISSGTEIYIDRAGGIVLYPNGQKVNYRVSGKQLPRVGSEYVLFLTCTKENPNYEILTGYELSGGLVQPLDTLGAFSEFKGVNKLNLLGVIRTKIKASAKPIKN
ncbi:MAG: hypothetical protein ACKVQW_02745 [Pyrinomonadaceae bacterium]